MRQAVVLAVLSAMMLSFLRQPGAGQDPAPFTPIATRAIATLSIPGFVDFLAPDDRAVWITNTGSSGRQAAGSVQRIDPATNRVTATIPVGPIPQFLAAGEGGIWTLNQGDGSVTRIDPRNNRTVASIPLGMAGGGGDIAAGGGRIWVRSKKVLLASIDPATNRVAEIFGPPAGSGAVRVAGDLVWVTAHDTKTVWVLQASK